MPCKNIGIGWACTVDESNMPGVIHAGQTGWHEEDWWTYSDIRSDALSVGACVECGAEDEELVYDLCYECAPDRDYEMAWGSQHVGFREGLAL